MNLSSKRSGFTIIEILVVVSIIGLLSAVVLVGLTSFRQRGRDARRVADLRQVQNALELYYAKNGEYPSAANWGELTSALIGDQIGVSQIPDDPLSDDTITYFYATTNQNYALGAELEAEESTLLEDSYAPGEGEDFSSYAGDLDVSLCGEEKLYCVSF